MGYRLWIASDHAGASLKQRLIELLTEHTLEDLSPEARVGAGAQAVDYPRVAARLARRVQQASGPQAGLGILICGSGIGVSIAANRFSGVRAAHVSDPLSARLAREHNHANVLCLGARFVAPEYALELVRAWLGATPATEARHVARVQLIDTEAASHSASIQGDAR